MKRKTDKVRLRVKHDPGERKWYASAIDPEGNEISASPLGTEDDAERYMNHYRKYGAWQPS